jgi:membrane fusion protein, multidrug efflux system
MLAVLRSTVEGSAWFGQASLGKMAMGFYCARMNRNSRLLAAIVGVAVFGLGGCSGAVPKEGEQTDTDVAVQVGTVMKTDLRARIEAYGMVEPEPAKAGRSGGGANLAAPIAGIVVAIHVIEGQGVKAGDVVVQLDDRMAQAAVDKAQHAREFAEQVAARQDRILKFGGTSMQAKQEAEQRLAAARAELASAQAAIAQVQLASPLNGVVARINVQPGQTVDLNTVVAEIIDLKRLVATVNVPADEAIRLRAGQTADIFADSANTPATVGMVSFIGPSVNIKTGAATVRLSLAQDCGLRPGQFVRVRIVTEELHDRLAVPRESVVKADDEPVIYVVEGDKAMQMRVKTGLRDGNLIEVAAEGLKEGDTIVTVGAYGLPKETKVKITNR